VVTEEELAPTGGFEFLGEYYDISTQVIFEENVTVTIAYDDTDMAIEEEEALRLYHGDGAAWEDVTVLPVDTANNLITGVVTSFSGFTIGTGPQITWLPPLATSEVYMAQAGSTVPIKFQLTDLDGYLVSDANVLVSVTNSEGDEILLSELATYEPDIPGYKINAQTKDWGIGEYTINVSVPSLYLHAKYGLSIVEEGQAKGKHK